MKKSPPLRPRGTPPPRPGRTPRTGWPCRAPASIRPGLAVDINADGIHSAGREVYRWLDQNAYRYGFILRYPSDKTGITGISNEPWHYRYVGVTAAAEIRRQNLCLEEYLNQRTQQ